MKINYIPKLLKQLSRTIIRYPYVYHTPLTHRTPTPPLSVRLAIIPGTTTVARIEKCCISKLLRTDQRSRIRYPHTHRTPLTYRTLNRPPPDRLSDDSSDTAKVPGSIYFEHESCSK